MLAKDTHECQPSFNLVDCLSYNVALSASPPLGTNAATKGVCTWPLTGPTWDCPDICPIGRWLAPGTGRIPGHVPDHHAATRSVDLPLHFTSTCPCWWTARTNIYASMLQCGFYFWASCFELCCCGTCENGCFDGKIGGRPSGLFGWRWRRRGKHGDGAWSSWTRLHLDVVLLVVRVKERKQT